MILGKDKGIEQLADDKKENAYFRRAVFEKIFPKFDTDIKTKKNLMSIFTN